MGEETRRVHVAASRSINPAPGQAHVDPAMTHRTQRPSLAAAPSPPRLACCHGQPNARATAPPRGKIREPLEKMSRRACCFPLHHPPRTTPPSNGHPEEARQGPSRQMVQARQGKGLPRASRLQADPAEQKVQLPGEEQSTLSGCLAQSTC
jgi:hypothetical protein